MQNCQLQGKGALYTNDSVSVYYDASEKMRRPRSEYFLNICMSVQQGLP